MAYTPEDAKLRNGDTIKTLKDSRGLDGADNLANKKITKTRSGHIEEWNDNEGVEQVTFQHRSGSIIQMQPDGSVRFVSQAGKMGFEINGEGYVRVTGIYNMYVAGDAGFRINGDADWHVAGDMKVTVDGTYSIAAKNMTTKVAEKSELIANDIAIASADRSIFTSGGRIAVWSSSEMLVKSSTILTVRGTTKVDINP